MNALCGFMEQYMLLWTHYCQAKVTGRTIVRQRTGRIEGGGGGGGGVIKTASTGGGGVIKTASTVVARMSLLTPICFCVISLCDLMKPKD